MRHLFVDIETQSPVPIGDCGSYRYINDPGFRILLIAYALDDDPVRVMDLTETVDRLNKPEMRRFINMLYDPAITKVAHNAAFERAAFYRHFRMYPAPEQWLDTMVLSAYCGLPLSLGQVSEALKLPTDKAKDRDGKALIRRFCVPDKKGEYTRPGDRPDDWERFIEYNRQDVVAEREIFHLLERWLPDETEHKLWCLDAKINEAGVPIDRVFAKNAEEMGTRFKEELTERALEITHLDNPNSVSQVKAWLQEQEGLEVPSLNKKTVADVVAQLQSDEAKEFMQIRSMMAKTSVSKYDAMLRCTTDADNHARGCFQFYGSHTGRWAGRLIQFQNLPQNHMPDLAEARELVRDGDYDTVKALYDNVPGTLSELIRTALVPEEDQKFVVCDYSAIEARVTAWLAGEQWRLDVFKDGGDIYCASAEQMFKVPVVKHGVNGHLRQKGKIAELALGYGGGVGALKAFGADKMGMTDEDMGETVALWRESSPNVCRLWKKLERAAILCTTRKVSVGVDCPVPGIRYEWDNGIMWLVLPSGRKMAYYAPEYGDFPRKNGSGECLTYMVLNQTTRKWQRTETWGGKLTENLVQAVARDCLREAMFALNENGWDIRASVHDELICTEPLGSGRTWQDVAALMTRPIPWADGLPLAADGYDCPFYMKA